MADVAYGTMTERSNVRCNSVHTCLTKQVCALYCIYINYSNSVTYCAFCIAKQVQNILQSYNVFTTNMETRLLYRRPDARCLAWQCYCPLRAVRGQRVDQRRQLIDGAGSAYWPRPTAACASQLGHSHGRCQGIVNSSDSFIHSFIHSAVLG